MRMAPLGLGAGLARGNDHGGGQNSDESYRDPNDWQNLKRIQMTVATSTFSVIAFMGLLCTCLYLGCCRPKRHPRIHGRTWSNHPSFGVTAIPGGPLMMHHHHLGLDPANLNPYLIHPHYYADSNFNTADGLYHNYGQNQPSPVPEGEKPPPQQSATEQTEQQQDATTTGGGYRPFFAKMDWQPPDPPSYQSLGIANPIYNTDKIEERVPKGTLDAPDPLNIVGTKECSAPSDEVTETNAAKGSDDSGTICDRSGKASQLLSVTGADVTGSTIVNRHQENATEETSAALSNTAVEMANKSSAHSQDGGTIPQSVSGLVAAGTSLATENATNSSGAAAVIPTQSVTISAPCESLLLIESKDGGHPYPEGVKQITRKHPWEEFEPPPYNPSYMEFQKQD